MPLSRTTRRLIETGNFDALEDEWLAHLTESPLDLDYFAIAARSLDAAGSGELSRQLLEILDDQLADEKLWEQRLSLLERAGHLLFDNENLHGEIVSTLRSLYAGSDVFVPLAERLGLHRAIANIPKTWKKVSQLKTLLSYDYGTVVWMEGKGVGEIADVNIELERLRVDLVGKPPITVGFGAAAKMLEVLPEGHFLYRKVRDVDALRSLVTDEPSAALKLLLESMAKPLRASSIRDAVDGLIDGKAWSSWWSSARNHPQVVTTGKGARQSYTWAASSTEASEEVLRLFERADLKGKLEILRREAKRNADVASEMARTLGTHAAMVATERPADAFTIAETLESTLGEATVGVSSSELLKESADPADLVAKLDDKALRRRSLDQVREVREDWVEVFARLMELEAEPRILSEIAVPLAAEAPERLTAVFDEIVAHPRRKAAAFVWLAENLPSFPFLEGRNPLRLLQLILSAEHAKEFATFKSRLTKLVESSDTLPHLITHLDAEQASRAEELLGRAPYEEYVRQPLINALHLRFPELAGTTTDALYALPASIEARRTELKTLLNDEIPANRRAIEEARALGDLRENFEYKSARQRHEYLSALATKLDGDLRRVRAIDLAQIELSGIRIGTTVTLSSGDEKRTVTILGPWESDPDSGVISYESESAQRLLGKAVGAEIDEAGETWTVDSIAPLND